MSDHLGHRDEKSSGAADSSFSSSTRLTIPEAAELTGRSIGGLSSKISIGRLETDGVGKDRTVTIGELVRTRLLDGCGRPWPVPSLDQVGLPLRLPLDPEQLLTVAEVSEVVGIGESALRGQIFYDKVNGTLVRGLPGKRGRCYLIAVAELLRQGWIDKEGQPTYTHPSKRGGFTRPPRKGSGNYQYSIPEDLPTTLDDERIAIGDPELATLVLISLSRMIGKDRSRRSENMYKVGRVLREYAHIEVVRASEVFPAPCPEVDREVAIPTGPTVVNYLKETAEERNRCWRDLVDRDAVAARFEVPYVAAFLPVPLWRVVAAVIVDGPELANDRLRRFLYAESQRAPDLHWRQRGDDATVSVVTLSTYQSAFRRIYRHALVPLHNAKYPSTKHPSTYLRQWSFTPEILEVEGSEWVSDRSAPSRPLLRVAWQNINEDLQDRLRRVSPRTGALDSEFAMDDFDAIELVKTLPEYRFRNASLFRIARNRALLAVFAVVGGRKEATMEFLVSDYRKSFRDSDGELSAALGLRPGKTMSAGKVSWKPIPMGLELVLDFYLAVVERYLGHELPKDGPLFIPTLKRWQEPMTGHGVANIFGGNDSGMRPLLEKPHRDETGKPTSEPSNEPGYSPQTLRRAALQMVRQGATSYCAENQLNMDPECLSEVLLDHVVKSDRMGYADVQTVEGRIRWTKVAVQVTWEMLTTDRGARRVPDVERFQELTRLQKALNSERVRAAKDVEDLFDARFQGVSDGLIVEIQVAVHRLHQIDKQLAEIDVTLTRLEHDRGEWKVLPDDAEMVKVDLAKVKRGEPGNERSRIPQRIRDFLTVTELGQFAGSTATARRWVNGRLPFADGDPRNPWAPGAQVIDETLGNRKRRIDVRRMNESFFDSPAKRDRRDQLLAQLPVGFTQRQMSTPMFSGASLPTGDGRAAS